MKLNPSHAYDQECRGHTPPYLSKLSHRYETLTLHTLPYTPKGPYIPCTLSQLSYSMKLNPTHVQTLYTLDFPKCKEHRDTYLEQQETEKIETEARDVDRKRITKVYAKLYG
jgi:hypothetical protein